MPSITPSKSTATARIARVPYLNSAPFFRGLSLAPSHELIECVPRQAGEQALSGELTAGLLPLVDYFRLERGFERLGRFGIAVRGRARSVILFSRVPLRRLEGATIAITEETSTTAVLLRLLLEQRYGLRPGAYERGITFDADALLLIGDEALKFQATNARYPFETDLAFEWWLWQHLPFVFAVWAVRRDAEQDTRRAIETAVAKSLGANQHQLAAIAAEHAERIGVAAPELQTYLEAFIYRFSQAEEDGLSRFKELVDEHYLL